MNSSLKKDFAVVHQHIEKIIPLIIREPSDWMPYRWVSAAWGKPYNVAQCVWDAFHQCLRLAYAGQADLFRDVYANHLHHQRGDGWMPTAICYDSGFATGPDSTGQPFVVQAVLLYARTTGDLAWPAEIYEKLQRHLNYWDTERRAGPDLYCFWMESGFDNDPAMTFFRPRSVISASASALMWMEYRAMSRLAARLEKNADAVRYERKAEAIRQAINRKLWDKQYGCYANVDIRTGQSVIALGLGGLPGETGKYSFLSWHAMLVLYAGLAPKERARRHIEQYLLNPEHFWSRHGIRSLSARSEYYNNAIWGNPARYSNELNHTASNWQGPVWFPVNYFVFHALIRYGYPAKAKELADKMIRLLANDIRANGHMHENYDPETGRPLYAPEFASWNMLADIMLQELEAGGSLLFDALDGGPRSDRWKS